MGLENTVAHYEVQITRTGEGAKQAATDFKALEATVASTAASIKQSNSVIAQSNASMLASTVSFHEMAAGAKAVKLAMHEFAMVGTMVGMQVAPQMTAGVQTAVAGFKALKAATAIGAVAMAEIGVIIISVVQTLRLFYEMNQAHKAKLAELKSEEDLLNSSYEQRKHLLGEIAELAARGMLDPTKGQRLTDLLLSEKDATTLSARITAIARDLRQMFPDEQKNAKELYKLVDQMGVDVLEGYDKERASARLTYEERKEQLADLAVKAGMNFREVVEQAKVADDWLQKKTLQIDMAEAEARDKRFEKHKLQIQTIIQMEDQSAQAFAQGFSQAFVDFASGTKSAGEAFKEFAVQFLQQVAQMIMQMLILKAISSAFGWGGGAASGSSVSMQGMAKGGVKFAADGITTVSSPTYFPKFNVVAGEAGREMLTVLARPRFMSLGGVEAVVGQAGNNTLAITQAAALAGSGGGSGRIHLEISHSPEAKVRIIEESAQVATVRIVRQAQQNSPVRDAIRRASA